MNKEDINEISFSYLLNYNQKVNELDIKIDGPLKVKMPSNLKYITMYNQNDEDDFFPIKRVVDETDNEKIICYLIL
jgi:hypothetical protein